MSSPPLADLLSRTATHETGAWLIAVSLGAGLSAIPLLARRWLRPDLPRLVLSLAVGVAGACAGAALLPLLLRLPSLAATGDLGAWLYGDRMAIGALLGFALCAFLVARRLDLDPWRALDTLSPSMGVLVLAGRIGCFLEGCDFGAPSSLPWAVVYPPGSHAFDRQLAQGLVAAGGTTSLPVHPAQLYEALVGAAMLATGLLLATPLLRAEGTALLRAHGTPVLRAEGTPVLRAEGTPVLRTEETALLAGGVRGWRGTLRAATPALRPATGLVFRATLSVYAIGRLVVERFRGDERGSFGPLSLPDWLCIALLVWSVAGSRAEAPERERLRASSV